jgi:transcriptional regulator with XRE-family HTH domain
MPSETAILLVHCRMALNYTQKEFGDLVGKTKRTVQRWEDRGAILLPSEAEAIAAAVRPVRPDLAESILALGRATAEVLGTPAPMVPATPAALATLVQAAADAIGVTTDAIRPAVIAAFEQAEAEGVDVKSVVAGFDAAGG